MAPKIQSVQVSEKSTQLISRFIAVLLFLSSLHGVSATTTTTRILGESSSSALDECEKGDTKERFALINNQGDTVLKSCEWAAYKNTAQRCENEIVRFQCPITCLEKCQYSPYCQNYTKKFKIKQVKANLKCSDGRQANGKPKQHLCRIEKFAYFCPVSCGLPCSKTKPGSCQDRGDDQIIKTKIPTQKVMCDEPVKSWSREKNYCYNSKFNAFCPRTCDRCLSSVSPTKTPTKIPSRVPTTMPTFEQPSSEPSDVPSDVPSDEPSKSMEPTFSMLPTTD